MSTRKPHNQNVGYVCELRNRMTGKGHVVVYDKSKGFDVDTSGRWITVCEEHGTILSNTSLPLARLAMKWPDFCNECQREMVYDIRKSAAKNISKREESI